jgi:hypothetical protein
MQAQKDLYVRRISSAYRGVVGYQLANLERRGVWANGGDAANAPGTGRKRHTYRVFSSAGEDGSMVVENSRGKDTNHNRTWTRSGNREFLNGNR